MKGILAGLLVSLCTTVANADTLPGDTISTPFSDAAQHWLHGRLQAARHGFLLVAAQSTLENERASAKTILLDEFYFWPGYYQQYLHLADSLNFKSGQYEMAKLLLQQPPQQIQLMDDSLQIPFKLRNKAHVVVTVLINGQPVRLAVDSGAQRTLISSRKARKIGVGEVGVIQIQNYNQKTIPGLLSMADSLQLGGLTVRNLPVLVSTINIPGVDGLLGWDLLRQFAFTINYSNRQLTVWRSAPDSTLSANLLGGSQPMVLLPGPANSSLLLQVDTGSNEGLRLSPLGQTKIGPYQTSRKLGISSSVGQSARIRWGKHIKDLTLYVDGKSQPFRRIPLFDTDGMIGVFIRDGLLGGKAFRTGRLTLDEPNHHYEYRAK